MERHIPKPGERYMDVKRKTYQILCVASNVKTKEKMVVYQALYGEFECFVRPLGMFMDEIDHKKYPEILQKYRFELIDKKNMQQEKKLDERVIEEIEPIDFKEEPFVPKQEENGEEQANPVLLQFLDADTLEQKYQIIKSLGATITNRLIDDFAVTLDLVIPEGNVDIRYQQLLSGVRTLQKFETTRFRKR